MNEAAGTGTYGLISMLIWIVMFVGLMYLLVFLPQKRREKKTRQMLESLEVGSEVVTIGGVAGKIINIKDDEVVIETTVEKTKITFKKWAIKEVKELIKA